MSAPARSVRARVGRTPSASADSAAGLLASTSTMLSSSAGPYSWPITRARARALPPVASAICGCGGSSRASPLRTASRAASISAGVGGSPCRREAVKRSEPRSTERTHPGPRSSVPTTTSVEPPPTSQTATTPFAGVRSRDGAREGEPALVVGGDDPHRRRPSRGGSRRGGAPENRPDARRGDDGLELADTELAGDAGVLAGHLPYLVELAAADASVEQDLLAEPQVLPLLAQRCGRRRRRPTRRAGGPCSSPRRSLRPSCPSFSRAPRSDP